ncbi:MAG: glycoside hydrolase family 3 [Deltaproteobacteria bacterium]|nr:glycoside hydrolase family 3 [Deltaproteobacteria bacterium]
MTVALALAALLCPPLYPPHCPPLYPKDARAASGPFQQPLSLDAMIGQMLMTGFRGDGTADTAEFRAVTQDVRAGRIGGVILFDRDWQTKKRARNIRSTAQLTALCAFLQKNAPIPLFIAVDQEGGRVQRLRPEHGFPATPSASELGTGTPAETRKAARALGKRLRRIGITLNFAPVADVAVAPEGPAIGLLGRAFSRDAEQVAAHAAAFAEGLGQAGVIGCYKHFPGHGSAAKDSHHGLTDITASWSEDELVPYAALPRAPLMVMTGHLLHEGLDPQYPASLSRAITSGLLRERLGWNGVVVTDDLEMDAVAQFHSLEDRIRLAVSAGADIILFGNNLQYHPERSRRLHAALKNLVESGRIPPERIAESWARIRALKETMD